MPAPVLAVADGCSDTADPLHPLRPEQNLGGAIDRKKSGEETRTWVISECPEELSSCFKENT